MGCALQAQEGDGLVPDGWEVRIDPVAKPDAGRADAAASTGVTGVAEDCKQLALFQQSVMPLLVKKYDSAPVPDVPPPPGPQSCVDCHSANQKPKAFAKLAMDEQDPVLTCYVVIAVGTKMENDTLPDILTSSDPNRPNKVHDFKFKNLDDYTRFHDAVVAWLSAEKQ